jgi:5-formyltetrahydrofolate cyclo-ligase
MPDFPSDAEISGAGKNALRTRLLAARRSMPTPDRLSAAVSIQTVLLSLVRAHQPSTIAGYVPVGPEPGGADLPDVLVRALPPGGRLLLPVLLDDGDLDWVAYSGRLVPGPRGLSEPAGVRLGLDAIREAALVVVPALAISSTGVRLGRGGGSYDRALSRLASATPPPVLSPHPDSTTTAPRPDSTAAVPHPDSAGALPYPDSAAFTRLDSTAPGADGDPLTVALLYDGELVDVIPAEAHDRTVRAAITPGGGLALSRAAEWTN